MTGETKMEERVRELEIGRERTDTILEQHVKSCDKRNEAILKIVLWALLGIVIIVFEQTFNIHVPASIPVI